MLAGDAAWYGHTKVRFAAAPTEPGAEVVAALRRSLARLSAPGTWFDGDRRRAIAITARAKRLGHAERPASLGGGLEDAVGTLAARPGTMSRPWVESVGEKLGLGQYVELLGVVSQAVAMDTFVRLLGTEPPDLAEPEPGDPCRLSAGDLGHSRAWIPSGRYPSPPTVLAVVPDEVAAQNALSDVL